jgi:hypothetical protein
MSASRLAVRTASAGAIVLALSTWPAIAQAQAFRTYLASQGLDSNPCTLSAPCRLLPAALAAVASGGEVWMLDSANYNVGPVDIIKSVTILAVPGALGSVVATNGNAIEIATAGIEVALRNLVIVPLPGAGGTNGIHMTAGDVLTVENCLIANLPQTGIDVSTPAIVRVTDTTLRDSVANGALIQGGARAIFTRTRIGGMGTDTGIGVYGSSAGTTTTADIADSILEGHGVAVFAFSFAATAPVKVSVRGSRLVRNASVGALAISNAGAAVSLSISDNIVSNNVTGIRVGSANARAWASGNTVSDNGTGFANAGGLFESAGDNAVRNNTTADTAGVIGVVATM